MIKESRKATDYAAHGETEGLGPSISNSSNNLSSIDEGDEAWYLHYLLLLLCRIAFPKPIFSSLC